jgi:hypothetical protein
MNWIPAAAMTAETANNLNRKELKTAPINV